METLRVAQVISSTGAEGPGNRFALWVQGCHLRCAHCCNPELFSPKGGTDRVVSDLLVEIKSHASKNEGISVLGGEPFEQPQCLALLAEGARALGQSVMIYSGFTLEELRKKESESVNRALAATDLLVDGRYVESLKSSARRWVGSNNQVMHFLSETYSNTEPRFLSENSIEIRLNRNSVTVNGWPQSAELIRPK